MDGVGWKALTVAEVDLSKIMDEVSVVDEACHKWEPVTRPTWIERKMYDDDSDGRWGKATCIF